MKSFLVILSFLTFFLQYVAAEQTDTKIVGGEIAKEGQFMFPVSKKRSRKIIKLV